MDKRKLYIDLLIEFCGRSREEAEKAIDETLERRRIKKEQEELGREPIFT